MDKEVYIIYAKLAEQTERYEDMKMYMKRYTEEKGELRSEERNLLSVAYKNVVGARRSSSRTLSCIDAKEEGTTKEYQCIVVKELVEICNEVVVSVSISLSS